jgi:hypothetical protein
VFASQSGTELDRQRPARRPTHPQSGRYQRRRMAARELQHSFVSLLSGVHAFRSFLSPLTASSSARSTTPASWNAIYQRERPSTHTVASSHRMLSTILTLQVPEVCRGPRRRQVRSAASWAVSTPSALELPGKDGELAQPARVLMKLFGLSTRFVHLWTSLVDRTVSGTLSYSLSSVSP